MERITRRLMLQLLGPGTVALVARPRHALADLTQGGPPLTTRLTEE